MVCHLKKFRLWTFFTCRFIRSISKGEKENVVIIGARALDEGEKDFIRNEGIKVFSMHEIDRMGMTAVMEETIAYLSHTDGVHFIRFRRS